MTDCECAHRSTEAEAFIYKAREAHHYYCTEPCGLCAIHMCVCVCLFCHPSSSASAKPSLPVCAYVCRIGVYVYFCFRLLAHHHLSSCTTPCSYTFAVHSTYLHYYHITALLWDTQSTDSLQECLICILIAWVRLFFAYFLANPSGTVLFCCCSRRCFALRLNVCC